MSRFANAREAKEFLVAKIVEEAQREGAPLSEIERKMLYFTETGWTLPDMMDVNDEFERTCDPDEYENKIARLVKHAMKRAQREYPEEYNDWWAAIGVLGNEDHYISIPLKRAAVRPPGDLLRLWGTGCAVVLALLAVAFIAAFVPNNWTQRFARHIPSKNDFGFYMWAGSAAVLISYAVLLLIYGKQKANEVFSDVVAAIFGIFFRTKK